MSFSPSKERNGVEWMTREVRRRISKELGEEKTTIRTYERTYLKSKKNMQKHVENYKTFFNSFCFVIDIMNYSNNIRHTDDSSCFCNI